MRSSTAFYFVEENDFLEWNEDEEMLRIGTVRLVQDEGFDLRMAILKALYPEVEVCKDNNGQSIAYLGVSVQG